MGGKEMYEIGKKDYYIMLRKKHKITLQELSEHIGCSKALICRWEKDQIPMDLQKQHKYYQYIDKKINGEM